MIIDTHSHLQFNAFKGDAGEVVKKTLAENIWMINVGTKYETSKNAVELAEKYPEGVYAAIGLHPIYAAAEFVKTKTDPDEGEFLIHEQDFDKEKYKALAASKKVVAIGEVGLDYYYKPKTVAKLAQFKEKQKEVFIKQLDLAKELDLPLILHCRMAHDDVIEILKLRNESRGVIHCFTGTWEQAQKYMEMGFYLGINGIIFKFNIDEVIKNAPLEKLVVETDCPYLTPKPEGDKRNEPVFIKHTIQRIAELKGISFDEVAQKTTENAKKLFKI
ncbi:MAG: TatD family hydrolase [bacterium]|nr:TatD family hydrolase [bacterium]